MAEVGGVGEGKGRGNKRREDFCETHYNEVRGQSFTTDRGGWGGARKREGEQEEGRLL